MALRTDYTDDILDLDQNTNRKYTITNNQDNSVSFTDVTAYAQEGSTFGADDFNRTNAKVNELENSFSQALTDLKATAIAQAVGAVGNTFASVIATLATIVNRGAVSKTLGLGESYTVPQGYHNGSGKVSVSITSQEKTITASRSQQIVTPDNGKVLSKVTVNKYPDASGTYTATSRGSALDMGAGNNLRYVNTNGVPNTNSDTYNVTSNGTKDMGATNTNRYVSVNVPNTNSGTYNATSRNSALDMGANNSIRYVNTNGVPNTNSDTYSVTSNGTKDMGATNNYRYVSVSVPMQESSNTNSNGMGGGGHRTCYTSVIDTANTFTKLAKVSSTVSAPSHTSSTTNTITLQGSNDNSSWSNIKSITFDRGRGASNVTGATEYTVATYRYLRGYGDSGSDGNETGSLSISVYHT